MAITRIPRKCKNGEVNNENNAEYFIQQIYTPVRAATAYSGDQRKTWITLLTGWLVNKLMLCDIQQSTLNYKQFFPAPSPYLDQKKVGIV